MSEEDLAEAFGYPVKSLAEHEDVGWYEAEVVLDSPVTLAFRVFVSYKQRLRDQTWP